jgi:uncharacterized protein
VCRARAKRRIGPSKVWFGALHEIIGRRCATAAGGSIPWSELPATAAWLHRDARSGFEVVYFHRLDDGWRIDGCTTAIEEGRTWAVDYEIRLDVTWTTRSAHVSARSTLGPRSTVLEADGRGRWLVDGRAAPQLDGCLDVDLEFSAMTNAFPVHRVDLPAGERAAAPAAYVRAPDLAVERLKQTYVRVDGASYDYSSPAFGFECRLVYDDAGLVLDYPGLAVRAG